MKIIEQTAVIADLDAAAAAIRNALGERFALYVADIDTDHPRAMVVLADTDGSGGYVGVTVTGPAELGIG